MDSASRSPVPCPHTHVSVLEYILLGDLRDLLEEPPTKQTREWFKAILDALLGSQPPEFELEVEEEYLALVLERYPNWYPQVERLQQEHAALFEQLWEFRRRLMSDRSFARVTRALKSQLRDWIQSLAAHRRHEHRLLQTAVNLETGGGD